MSVDDDSDFGDGPAEAQEGPDSPPALPSWYHEIFPAGPCRGFFRNLGLHSMVHVERDPKTLVVSFDNLAEAGGRHLAREAWAGKFVRDNGWSHLGIFAQGPTWFRDAELIAALEKMRDDGFFAQYDRVTFCGTSMGGFGALTFAGALSPGATVIAFSPQTTLAKALVPWEHRFAKGRGQDWSLPYSDAASQTAGAGKVFVVCDRFTPLDMRHLERLSGDNLVPLMAPGLGHKSALLLRRMDKLKPVMKAAIEGTLTAAGFAALIGNRKDIYLYKRNMEDYLLARDRTALADRFRTAFRRRRKSAKRRAAR